MSLFRAPNGLKELPEERSEFLFILIGKSTVVFLTSQSWRVLKSWYTGRPEQGFRRCFADGLNQSLASSTAQTRVNILNSTKTWKEAILTTSLVYQS